MYHGHIPWMGHLLHDQKFVQRIKHVHIDEVHNVYTSGIKRNRVPAFCPAWGALDEVHTCLAKGTSCQALSATLPPHILKVINDKLTLSSNCHLIQTSINRPNIMYATHPLVGNINNFRNLDCIILQQFHPPMCLPKLLIVHDNKTEANNASNHLNV